MSIKWEELSKLLTKKMYKCTSCWQASSKWVGKCPSCDSWNTLIEIEESNVWWNKAKSKWKQKETLRIISGKQELNKTQLTSDELNNVFWWWLTKWSLTLLSGEPWIGKSTLAIQIADWFARDKRETLYISSEENVYQLSARAERLKISNNSIQILNTSNLEDIIETIEWSIVELIIIDSISIIASSDLNSSSGSITQIKYIAERLMELAKKTDKSIILIWHVTKDWTISWPKILEHLVDTVLYLEWSRYENYRILRSLKNRFWPTDEVWLFLMTEKWMQDLKNPWLEFINKDWTNLSGSALTMTIEWNRSLLVEIEALTTYTKFWYPKRSCRWINSWKLDLLIAVITKFSDIKLDSYDVYLNISRWLNIQEPWIDLAIIAAIMSSKKDKSLWKSVFIWEVSLTWIVKNVFNLQKRIDEAIKLWFERIIIPAWIIKEKTKSWKIIEVKNIKELEKVI